MAKLTTSARKAIPKAKFALPGGTKKSSKPAFPVEDKPHATAALRLVNRSLKAGNITPSQAATVRRKARAELGKKTGGAKKAASKRS